MTAAEPAERVLCRLEDIPDGAARGFPGAHGAFTGLFAVRRGTRVHVYVNACPHIGLPLEPMPDRFLDARRQLILCSAHGARFRIEDGMCVSGPCLGAALEAVPARVEDGVVVVPAGVGL
ncbi:MAG TPA: Rieske (2Fe-2S) protein [Crenalkalicoccus sp.]|nr:Rieske (2Fe-2S) protein [Crenalkalicoccus sp.]